MAYLLHQLLRESVHHWPDKTAVVFGESSLTYSELDALSDQLAEVLRSQGLARGDRIGIYISKSRASIISIFGILKAGACYVPLDSSAPSQRIAYIIQDSGIKVLVSSSKKVQSIREMFPDKCPLRSVVLVDCDIQARERSDGNDSPDSVSLVRWDEVIGQTLNQSEEESAIENDTAYILYTSGSTGSPKGVRISHRNALAFVDWATDCVALEADDRVSNHAPLHFDLSIFDIFASCKAGAAMVLVPEGVGTFPVSLGKLIEEQKITVWYSVPSALTLLVIYGDLASRDLSRLRTIIFAGEVFPMKYLRRLMETVPHARYLNWYGPTETNVCTWYELAQSDSMRSSPVPIGKQCANTEVFAVDNEENRVMRPSQSGELYVRGPSVMQGYWGDPEKTAKVLVPHPLEAQSTSIVYRTGDIVTLDDKGNYIYVGRQDGMIKTRGYRVELGEIETVLYAHPSVKEVAVLPVPDEILGNRLRAVITTQEGSVLTREQILEFCGQKLPRYMIPDIVEFRDFLPKTSTGKTDRVELNRSYAS
jgi:amino acid adenylation domain-containing protein